MKKLKYIIFTAVLLLCLKNCITFTVLAESDAVTSPDSVMWDETTADTAMLDESSALRTTESLKSDEEESSLIKNGQVSNIEERSEKAEENVSEAIRDIEPNADILSNRIDLSNGKAEDNKNAQSEMQCENITQGNEEAQSEAESVDSAQNDEKKQSEQYASEDNQDCEKVQPGAESLDVSDSTTIQPKAVTEDVAQEDKVIQPKVVTEDDVQEGEATQPETVDAVQEDDRLQLVESADETKDSEKAKSATHGEEETLNREAGTVYADNSNFQEVLINRPDKIILTETIIWDKEYNDDEAADFTAETPIEVELGEYGINVKENCRLTFFGPFSFTGSGNLFNIEGELFLNGSKVVSSGEGTEAIVFSGSPVPEGKFTMRLELDNVEFSINGTDAAGIKMVQGAGMRALNTSIICAGEGSAGVINVTGSEVSIYQQSRFEVSGGGAAGMIVSGKSSSPGLLDFDAAAIGADSRGIIVQDEGIYTNKGTVIVSGSEAVGIELKEEAHYIKDGAVIVSNQESMGIFAAGNLEASRFSLKAESGMAAEAGGSITFILCDVDAPRDGFLSHSGKIVLDTCKAADVPDGTEIKTRKAQPFLNGYETPDGDYLFYDVGVFGFSIPVGAAGLILPDTLAFSLYDEEDSAAETMELLLSVEWEQAEYDADRSGDYEIHYRADTNGLLLEIAGSIIVHVYDGEKPRLLYAVRLGDKQTELHFSPRVEDSQQIRLWVSADGGDAWNDYIADGQAQAWGQLGFAATDALEDSTNYLIRLEVCDGADIESSPVLSYFRSEREIKWYNGDRDGGDQRPQEDRPNTAPAQKPNNSSSGSHNRPPQGVATSPAAESEQPESVSAMELKPEAEQKPEATVKPETEERPESEPQSAPAFAQNSADEIPAGSGQEITKKELEDLAQANPEKITVASNGIKAVFPTEALEAVNLEPDEKMTIVLERPAEYSFNVRLYAGEREVSSLGGKPIEVTVPVSGYVSRAVSRTGGEPVQADVSNNGSAVFSVPEPGSYSMDIPANQRDDKRDNTKPYIWICILGILLCGGLIVWFCLRKMGRRI